MIIVGLMLVFLGTSVHAQQADEQHLQDLEIACGFGVDEACDELIDLEEADKTVSLTICNRTVEEVSVAIANEVGEVKDRRYHARGWRSLDPDACHDFWQWPVKDAALHVSILHLIYVEAKTGAAWSGNDAVLCTLEGPFDITGDHLGDCRKRGYININIFEGGRHKSGHTVDITR